MIDKASGLGKTGPKIKYPYSHANCEAKMLFDAFGFRSQEREKCVDLKSDARFGMFELSITGKGYDEDTGPTVLGCQVSMRQLIRYRLEQDLA